MSYPAFGNMELRTRVRALKDITTKNRTMRAGDTGQIIERWAYMVGVRPDGKRLTVQTTDQTALEIITDIPPNKVISQIDTQPK